MISHPPNPEKALGGFFAPLESFPCEPGVPFGNLLLTGVSLPVKGPKVF